MNITFFYWLAFISYSIIVIGIGFYIWAKKRKEKKEEADSFWTADKTLSGWSSGLSISASMMSISWSCVYGVQLFYWYGIGAAWLLIIPWLLTMGGFFLFTPIFRKLKAFSQPELLANKFGPKIRSLISIPLIFVFIVWGGAEIYAAGITIAPFLNISVPLTMFLLSLVITIYTYTGGFQAVVSTDKIQFVLVALFILILAIVGYSAVYSSTNSLNLFEISSSAPKLKNNSSILFAPGLALIVITFIAYLPGWLVETDIWIRLQASRSNKEARKGIIVASTNSFLFVGILPMVIGLSALILYPTANGVIPAKLQDGALIFQNLMADYTPVWLNVLLGIGLIAAAMSTVDTCGNVVALSLSYDIVEPIVAHKLSQKNIKHIASWISVFAILLAFIYALFTNSLWDIFYLSSGILTTTVFIPVISVFLPNTKKNQVVLSIIFGFIGTLIFYFLESRGMLSAIEPDFIASTKLGYILYGFIMSILGFVGGKFFR